MSKSKLTKNKRANFRDATLDLCNSAKNGNRESQEEIIKLHKERFGEKHINRNFKCSENRKRDIKTMIQHLLR